jgi:hypothetical protein
MVVEVKPARRAHDTTPSDPAEPVPGDGSAVARRQVARPAIAPTSQLLTRLAPRWPHIEAALVRRCALSRRRR